MRSYVNLAVLALATSTVSPALSAPIQYRYGNLLVEFKGWAVLISGIPLGTLRLGTILIPLLTSFVAPNSFVPLTRTVPLAVSGLPVALVPTFSLTPVPVFHALTLPLTLLPNPVSNHSYLALQPDLLQTKSHLL